MKQGQSFQDIAKKIPNANRIIFVILTIALFLDLGDFTSHYLMNSNLTPPSQFYIWQILTASLGVNRFFMWMLMAINMYTFFPKLELKTSKNWILTNFIINGFIIQILYSVIIRIMPDNIRSRIGLGDASGIWFNFVFKYCYFNPRTKIKLCCFPIKLSKLAYPFALAAFIMLWNSHIKLDAVIGIFLAFIQCKYLMYFSLEINRLITNKKQNPYIGLEEYKSDTRYTNGEDKKNDDYFSNKKGIRLCDA